MGLLERRGHQHGAAVKGAGKLTNGLIHDRVMEWMTGTKQVGTRMFVVLDTSQNERHTVILGRDGPVLAGTNTGRHVGDFISPLLAPGDPAAQPGEGCLEGKLDVVRLKAAGTSIVHGCAQRLE